METTAKVGQVFIERASGVKFPRIVKLRKIEKFGALDYVYFMAENQAAQTIHPNGGFTPMESFLKSWKPYDGPAVKNSRGNGSG